MTARTHRARRFAAATALIFLFAGCGTPSSTPYLDLSHGEAVATSIPQGGPEPLRVAVAAVLSPEGNIDSYTGLVRYLGERLERPVELVQRRTYAEVNELIADGAVDVAFVCTSAYVVGSAQGEMDLLVVPEVNGETVYRSSVIVPAASNYQTVGDLAGGTFAFTDPMSLTGRVYPTHLIEELDSTPETFFASTFFTYSHDRAIDAVADAVADGAAVDSLVLNYALLRDPELADRIRVIHTSQAFGIPPVVVPAGASPDFRSALQKALLDISHDSIGDAILSQIGVDRFVLGTDAAYDEVRQLMSSTKVGT